MRALDRKVIRDLLEMKGQAVAIALVMACGVATFVMSLSTLDSLRRTMDTYYDRYRFAQVFLHLKRAPARLAAEFAEIPGVAQVQTRIVVDVSLDVPGLVEPAVGRLISIREHATPGLNDLYLRSGRRIEPGRTGEVLASEAFAAGNHLKPGDVVRAIINGRRQSLAMVGVALSPEYIYQIREGEILPDNQRFGVFWMGEEGLAAAFDMKGAFNDVALTLMPGASEPEVIRRLDRLTAPYGGLGAYARADQVSHRFVTNEMRELRGMSLVAPVIFLSVAAFLLNVVMSRLIGTQREQIAALKAFGYTRLEVGVHYLKLVLIVSVVGGGLGTLVGSILGQNLTLLYTRFFHFPVFEYHLPGRIVVLALAISFGAAVLGTLSAIRRAVILPPAEAMRPEPPAGYHPTLIERIVPRWLFSSGARMILRQLGRRPVKSALSCLGIALAVAVLVLGSFMADALDYLIDYEFHGVQRHDLTVTLVEATSAEALGDLKQLEGVVAIEPFRALPARLRLGHRARRLAILGLLPQGDLHRLLDQNWKHLPLPQDGLVLSAKLAEILHVHTGDTVTAEVLEGSRPSRPLRVAGLVSDLEGLSAYMDLRALNRLMREGPTVSGAYLKVDERRLDRLYTELKNMPKVAGVTVKEAALETFRDTVAENMMRMRAFNVAFACIIAFGVVYNTARISLSERSRELATLRVMGFTRGEISLILLGELALLTVTALPLGFVMGHAFAGLATMSLDTEMFRVPLVVRPATFAMAATVTLVSALVSGLVVRRRLDTLDLVAVLKTRE